MRLTFNQFFYCTQKYISYLKLSHIFYLIKRLLILSREELQIIIGLHLSDITRITVCIDNGFTRRNFMFY